jgi:hypothetical protein
MSGRNVKSVSFIILSTFQRSWYCENLSFTTVLQFMALHFILLSRVPILTYKCIIYKCIGPKRRPGVSRPLLQETAQGAQGCHGPSSIRDSTRCRDPSGLNIGPTARSCHSPDRKQATSSYPRTSKRQRKRRRKERVWSNQVFFALCKGLR